MKYFQRKAAEPLLQAALVSGRLVQVPTWFPCNQPAGWSFVAEISNKIIHPTVTGRAELTSGLAARVHFRSGNFLWAIAFIGGGNVSWNDDLQITVPQIGNPAVALKTKHGADLFADAVFADFTGGRLQISSMIFPQLKLIGRKTQILLEAAAKRRSR